jgi:lycopene cyclase domain-containing protein
MSNLYLILDIAAVFFPLILSFDKKVAYYKSWKAVFSAILIVGIPFVAWDIYFTQIGVWGFNPAYLVGLEITNLPIEEILFFIIVPFACTFIFACLKAYFKELRLKMFNQVVYIGIAIYAIVVLVLGFGTYYANIVSILALITVFILSRANNQINHLPLAFIISLIPFFIMNAVLTGTGIENEIVWYNDLQNSSFRFNTIPIEDVMYAWVLIGWNVFLYERIQNRKMDTLAPLLPVE